MVWLKMNEFKYLIVGGGMAADSAAKGIRSVDNGGNIGMITDEPDPPYDRPPLSKGLWKGKSVEKIWRKTEARGVMLFRERHAVSINPDRHEVVDHQGSIYHYDRLLLATGGTPRHHPASGSVPIYYRTLGDYRRLRTLADENWRFIVVGGGFIGSEIAAALAMNGKNVVMAFPEPGICSNILPPDLTAIVNRCFEDKGIRMFRGRSVAKMAAMDDGVEVCLDDGNKLVADAVVAGLGITPNTELAVQAGLDVDNGIMVDEYLQTSNENIFAAGDVACFHSSALDKRIRAEHEDNANAMGIMAGKNMAGAGETYHYLPYFYSDLFHIGYEAVGETDPSRHTVIEWVEPGEKGVVFYLNGEKVRGVLFWNIFGKLNAARQLIMSQGPYSSEGLKTWTRETLALQTGNVAMASATTESISGMDEDPGLTSLLRMP